MTDIPDEIEKLIENNPQEQDSIETLVEVLTHFAENLGSDSNYTVALCWLLDWKDEQVIKELKNG